MKKFYGERQADCFVITGEELAHFNVLRCKTGEQILCLGQGDVDYLCEVFSISKKEASAKIIKEVKNTKNPKVNITVFQGLVKGEKADLIVQKLTELGASTLCFFESEFTVAKGNNNKMERLSKISKEACKQCGRNIPLNILECINFKQMLTMLKEYDLILFANEKDTARESVNFKTYKNIAMIVGSEGGFSDEEVQLFEGTHAQTVSLGKRILRAETASVFVLSVYNALVGD